jgi:predicted metal-dependent hydrolase
LPGELRRIGLRARALEYRLARRRRRTIGITVDASGVRVHAPLRAPLRDVEAFLAQKERWILAKLAHWASAPAPVVLRGESGEALPLFGTSRILEVRPGPREVREEPGRIVVCGARHVLRALLAWLKERALAALEPRVGHYAALLGRDAPPLALSNARTQWGVCTASGAVRLNWRLVHLDPLLADYVVAHEVAHLAELNHSTRFWRIVEWLYPAWREARERLKRADASLPILRKSR